MTLPLINPSWRRVGQIIAFVGLVALIAFKKADFNFVGAQEEIVRVISEMVIVMGLLLWAFSKDRIEDERTMHLRLKAFAITILIGAVNAIVRPAVDLAFDVDLQLYTEQQAFMALLFFNNVYIMLIKRGW